MTDDDLMKRLQIGWHDEDTPPWVSNAMSEAKTRIELLATTNEQLVATTETLTAERDRLASLNVELCDNYNTLLVVRSRLQDRAETAEADNARMLGALSMIDAIDPEHHIDGCAQTVVRGLVLRMGETARAALTEGTPDE